jgi:large repetitive protein
MKGIDTHSRIEALEGRIAPAGLITVTFAKGALALTSDNGSHEFSITALDATTVRLSGTNGTLFHLDGTPDSDTLTLTTTIKSLSVTLGSDEDTFDVTGLNVSGDIRIDLGAGSNEVNFDSITTRRGLEIQSGAGPDAVAFNSGVNSIKKDLVLTLDDGDNSFSQVGTLLTVGGGLSYTGGASVDAINLNSSVRIKGSAEFNWDGGANTFGSLDARTLFFGKDLTFDSSASTSDLGETTQLQLSALGLEVLGTLRILDGDGVLSVSQASFGFIARLANVNIVTGGGTSEIVLGNSQIRAKSVEIDASEATSSQLTLGGPLGSFTGSLIYAGGAGADDIELQFLGGASFGGNSSFRADLGDGDNTVQVLSYSGFYKKFQLTGGSGEDNVQLGAMAGAVSKIEIDNGDGPASTSIQMLNSKINGQIKVTNGTGAGMGELTLGLFSSQVGGVGYTSDLASNTISFGQVGSPFESNDFTIKKSIEISTGDGSDSVSFDGAANSKVGKGINLNLGGGSNQVGGDIGNFVTKALTITSGSGTDSVNLAGSGNLGAVKLTLGGGINNASLTGTAVPLALSSFAFTSDTAAEETDSLVLARVRVLGKFNATLGASVSTLKIDDSVVEGSFKADTGAGADIVLIDTVDSNAGTILVKAVSLLLGEGSDSMTLGGNGTSQLLIAKSTFRAEGGAGTNTLTNHVDNQFAREPVFVDFA